ncbi:MAG: hypothetical protein IJU69_03355 [Bacteroidales bacterium]|nr:hypothetical protein [Bacteroidales bacterium]
MRNLFFPIAAATALLFVSCSQGGSLEKKFHSYLSQSGLQAEMVSVVPGDSAGVYVCIARVEELIPGFGVEETWDAAFEGGKVISATVRSATDSTLLRNLSTGEECLLGDYLEKDYIPHLVDTAFAGSPFVDSLLAGDRELFLRHRDAWLATVPIGDRAIYQLRGPVKSFVTNFNYWDDGYYGRAYGNYFDEKPSEKNGDGYSFNADGTIKGAFDKVEKNYSGGKAISLPFGKGSAVTDRLWDGYAEKIRYDDNGLVVFYQDNFKVYEGTPNSYDIKLTYDKLGNCIKKETTAYMHGDRSPDFKDERTYGKVKYTILKTDRLGNWTERQAGKDHLETRTITYYLPE